MQRRSLFTAAAAFVLAACKKERTNVLPESVDGWKRISLGEAPVEFGAVRAQLAQYQAPQQGTAAVTVYEMKSSAAALDVVQRWVPKADTLFFYRDELFVVVKHKDADRKALNTFVAALDKHLAPAK